MAKTTYQGELGFKFGFLVFRPTSVSNNFLVSLGKLSSRNGARLQLPSHFWSKTAAPIPTFLNTTAASSDIVSCCVPAGEQEGENIHLSGQIWESTGPSLPTGDKMQAILPSSTAHGTQILKTKSK